MKPTTLPPFILLALLPGGCIPLGGGSSELASLRAEKRARPVFRLTHWCIDFDQAREQAAKEGKLLFAYFAPS